MKDFPNMTPVYRIKNFLISLFLSFFIFSLMIMFTVLWIDPFYQQHGMRTAQYVSLPRDTDQLNLLLIQDQQPFTMISIQPHHALIKIESIPEQSNINGHTLHHYYQEMTTDEFISFVSSYYQIHPLHYVILSEDNLHRLVDLLGGITIHVDTPLHLEQAGIDTTLSTGTQHLTGEQVLHYLDKSSTNHLQIVEAIVQEILDLSLSDNFQYFYAQMLDCMDSNLTFTDYDHYYPAIRFMMELIQ